MSGWSGGLHIRRMERGQVAVVDFLCTACWTHRRTTGRALVADYLASDPIGQHRAICPARGDHMNTCGRCGAPVPPGAGFCKACGAPAGG